MTHQAAPDVNKCLPPLVESPSGHLLGTKEFLAHPNRPLAIRERQESIRRALEQANFEGPGKEEVARGQGSTEGSKETKSSISGTLRSHWSDGIRASGSFPGREEKASMSIPYQEEQESGCCLNWFGR